MPYHFKLALCWLLFIITLPLAAFCWLLDKTNRHQHAFASCAKLLSLVPGTAGRYLRTSFYKLTLDHCHYDLSVDFCSFFSKRQVRLGRGVVIGSFSIIGKAIIGNGTLVASRVSILSGKYQHGSSMHNTRGNQQFMQIQIGSDNWIGENAVIMANLGNHCIVSAGGIVSKAMPDNNLAVGNPARFSPRTTIAEVTQMNKSDIPKDLHIVHFRSSNFIGGPEKQIISHLFQLGSSDSGQFRRTLISFDEKGGHQLKAYCDKMNIECILLPPSFKNFIQARKYLNCWLENNNIDILCCHDYKSSFYGLSLRHRYDYKVIGFSRGATAESFKVRSYMWLDNQLMRFMDGIVAVAQSQADILASLNIHNPRLKVIENASTASAFAVLDDKNSTDVRVELGIQQHSSLVLSAGRLSSEKGHRFLIEAFNKISSKHNDCHLVLAGDGPLMQELQQLNNELGAKNVHFLGFRSDIVNLYQQCQIMSLPSLSEGLPNAVLEAMTFGCCVVASSVGGIPILVDDQHNGLLCEAGNSEQLACALDQLLSNESLQAQLCNNAKDTIAARYSPTFQAEKLIDLYNEVYSSES